MTALFRDRRGVVGFYFAIVIGLMVVMSVAALDLIRYHLIRTRLAQAADAGLLAAGRSLGSPDWQKVGVAYFNANMNDSLGGGVSLAPEQFRATSLSLGVDEVALRIRTSVPLWSAGLIDLAALDLEFESKARRRALSMELAMVLDNTGSMLTNDNIGALRKDALTLLNIIANGQTSGTLSNVSVAVVPYSAAVNAGAEAGTLVADVAYAPTDPLGWHGCTIEPPGNYTLANAPPANAGWRAYQVPNGVDNNFDPKKSASVRQDWTYGNGSAGPNIGCPTAITPLTQNIATLRTALNAMQAWSRGGTLSDVGMAWGLRVLSPEPPFTQGSAWNTPNMAKAVVMMTDGAAGYFKLTGRADPNAENTKVLSDYAAYGRVDQYGLLGVADKNGATSKINERLKTLCSTMRSKYGIQIYTITFGGLDETTKTIYRGCASSPDNYYNAPDQVSLENAFRSIGGALSELVLVQ